MLYSVILKVGYHDAYFDFYESNDAVPFAKVALEASTGCEDTDRAIKIELVIINKEREGEEDANYTEAK